MKSGKQISFIRIQIAKSIHECLFILGIGLLEQGWPELGLSAGRDEHELVVDSRESVIHENLPPGPAPPNTEPGSINNSVKWTHRLGFFAPFL